MADKLKTALVQLRLTQQEKEKLKALADESGMAVSVYIRYLIHREPLKPR